MEVILGRSQAPLRALLSAALLLLAFCWLAGSAQGALLFKSSAQIAGPAPGQHFGTLDPESVAVNDSNGHVLVADSSKGVIYDFESTSDTAPEVWDGSTTPQGSFGAGRVSVAVDQSSGDVYVADTTALVVDKFDAGGKLIASFGDSTPSPDGQLAGTATPAGSFVHPGTETPLGIAVNQTTHDLYVIDSGHEVVDEFDSGGAYLSQITEKSGGLYGCIAESKPGSGEFFPGQYTDGIAVNSTSGHVLVSDSCPLEAFEFEGGGTFLKALNGSDTPAGNFGGGYVSVAVDDTSGRIYVTDSADGVTDAFSEAGEYEGQIVGVPTGAHGAVATNPADSSVYVSDNGSGTVSSFAAPVIVPDVTTAPATEVGPGQATLNGGVNPVGEGEAQCQFIWGEGGTLNKTLPCPEAVPDGSSPVEVHAALGGLQRDSEYCFRLQASDKNGSNPGEASQNQCFRTAGPGLGGEWASEVTSESATLNARIDANGSPTSYYFQYGPSAAYGSTVPASPGQSIGAGSGEAEVIPQHIQGLSSASEYHYRLIVLSETSPGHTEEVTGPDRTFVTQAESPAASTEGALPDGRRWEQVTPQQKQGALVQPIAEEGVIKSAQSGRAITYLVNATTEAEAQGNAQSVQLLSRRGASGWASQDIAIPHETATGAATGAGQDYRFFSPDLAKAALQPAGSFPTPGSVFSLSPQASEQTPYVRTNLNDGNLEKPCEPTVEACYRPLVTAAPGVANVPGGTVFGEHGRPVFLGASDDLSHVILESNVALTEIPIGESGGLYEWSAEAPPAGQLKLVSVLPGPGGEAASGGLSLGSGRDTGRSSRGAIGPEGHRVFWEASTPSGEASLYARDVTHEKTLQLDAVQGGSGEGAETPRFQIADAAADRVLFTDLQRLRPDSGGSQVGGNVAEDLYECKLAEGPGGLSCELEDLTPLGPGEEEADVQGGVLGISKDGSAVYFVAKGALSGTAANEHGEVAVGGQPNLYVREGGQTKLVAVLSEGDVGDWGGVPGGILSGLTARVSPSGRYLAFMSQRSLTGYDNRDASSNQPDEEVYEFDKQSGHLSCASCKASGGRPEGIEYSKLRRAGDVAAWPPTTWIAANIPGWTPYRGGAPALYQSRYLSGSGRLFFNSQDPLVAEDGNGSVDVYQYEPEKVGGCKSSSTAFSSRSDGCVSLLSGALSNEESAFLDASENGDDVFFMSAAALGKQDSDSEVDVYDAHVCSSESPCAPEAPQRPLACSNGDACKAAPSPQPSIFGAPPSALFSGAGNVIAAPESKPQPKPKPLTRAQKLQKALKACKKKPKRKRASCQREAHRKFDPRQKKAKAKKGVKKAK